MITYTYVDVFPLIKLAKKLKAVPLLSTFVFVDPFPLIKLAKKLKGDFARRPRHHVAFVSIN